MFSNSLDIEGAEFGVLKTVPWDKVDIEVLLIELIHAGSLFKGSREEIHQFLLSKNYVYLGSICMIFVCPFRNFNVHVFYFSRWWCFCEERFVKNKIWFCGFCWCWKVPQLVYPLLPVHFKLPDYFNENDIFNWNSKNELGSLIGALTTLLDSQSSKIQNMAKYQKSEALNIFNAIQAIDFIDWINDTTYKIFCLD